MTSPKSPAAGTANTPSLTTLVLGSLRSAPTNSQSLHLDVPRQTPLPVSTRGTPKLRQWQPQPPPTVIQAPLARWGLTAPGHPLAHHPSRAGGRPDAPETGSAAWGRGTRKGACSEGPTSPPSSPGNRGIPPPRSRCSIAPPSPAPSRGGRRTTRSHPTVLAFPGSVSRTQPTGPPCHAPPAWPHAIGSHTTGYAPSPRFLQLRYRVGTETGTPPLPSLGSSHPSFSGGEDMPPAATSAGSCSPRLSRDWTRACRLGFGAGEGDILLWPGSLARPRPWITKAGNSLQFSSVAQSCPTLCNPMNRSTPGLPVHHKLPEFTQTHVPPVGDAIQPFHPLSFVPFSSCPQSLPASGSFPMRQLFA